MKNFQFYYCDHCGLIVKLVEDGCKLQCCGHEVEPLTANTKDAALEKHVPEIKREGNKLDVVVGSVEHPMTEEHYIMMIAVVQNGKLQVANLTPNDEPKASFTVEEGPAEVYEFCNLHGLWKAEA